ncbi:hypothetical protein IEZ26_15825 [Nocardioides cavernae]|uniref:PD-(D/E)XK endonuclease-like domain-containing protein n=2 Tax=Nocardioides cavernae TaxID=1921566 RepID=A0ABR8ND81_9ACTN|nr:hypothetical protein [Nocardioides cavernae]
MSTKVIGGGSSAVAASAHAACARFRRTDPLITGMSRRALAEKLGHPDTSGRIPDARWMRAMTFERLVKNEAFASQTVTTTVGAVGLNRPSEVVIADAKINKDRTADLLSAAHQRAIGDGAATLIHQLAVPFAGFENTSATDVKPDFAVVAPTVDQSGSWLVVGDAKDYERHRSRVEDSRLLKGFLQVAVGAESAAAWSKLPAGMSVHRYGALAVPRNAFLQPEALVEDLADHRREVAMRIAERRAEAKDAAFDPSELDLFTEHLVATFDPGSCPSCSLFAYCRAELRKSADPTDVLVEIGIPRDVRPLVAGIVDGTGHIGAAQPSLIAQVVATNAGVAQQTKQRRVDPIGLPGTVNFVLAKADAASLGVHGIGIQVVTADGPGDWIQHVFPEPQSPQTRRAVVRVIGSALTKAIKDRRLADPDNPEPVHLVVPDKMTADVLVSIADNLAGLELSRLRWAQDKLMGRPQLTFDGEPAQVPLRLSEDDRTAVAFLLEDDRARAMTLRSPIVNAQEVLTRHHVVGGPTVSALRLDYVVAWFLEGSAVDHRNLSDEIENLEHTPGARLTNTQSNAIHATISGPEERRNLAEYDRLVRAELTYKSDVLTKAIEILDNDQPSRLRDVHRTIEADAQAVWQRRLRLHASDLVRFGRTYRWWRNALVEPIQDDQKCRDQLLALANPQAAQDLASDAGQRMVAFADVVSVDPLVLDVHSRRIAAGSSVVLLHVNDDPCVEDPAVGLKVQGGSFQFQGMAIGPLSKDGIDEDAPRGHLSWGAAIAPTLAVRDRVVVADCDWFAGTPYRRNLNVKRPAVDGHAAPKPDCLTAGYSDDPDAHAYCCKPHEVNEAEWSDTLAERRAAGLLNPQTWPPVRNDDAFEAAAAGQPQGDPYAEAPVSSPADLTEDDLD